MTTRPALAFACARMTDDHPARSLGAAGQFNQQGAMLARPDSGAGVARVRVPPLVVWRSGLAWAWCSTR